MAEEMLRSRPEFGKTFTTAMWLLGILAACQMFAVGWAIVTRPALTPLPPVAITDSTSVRPDERQPPPASITPVLLSDATPAEGGSGDPDVENFDPFKDSLPPLPPLPTLGNGGIGGNSGNDGPVVISSGPVNDGLPVATPPPASLDDSLLPAPNLGGPGENGFEPPSTALSNAAIDSAALEPIADPAVERMINSGAKLRSSGNMQGSLNALRQAEAVMPEHPRVLSEIATTYSEMGLVQKAAVYWKKVRELNTGGAEAFQTLAERQLSGDRLVAPAARSLLQLGRISSAPDATAVSGQRVILRVPVEADPKTRPAAADMAMLVYFYDRVNGTRTEASTADTSQNFITAPYTWQENGLEVIEVVYHQPEFTEGQKRELGERQYYGYIIELYYRDQLQDTAADPPELSALDPGAPTPPEAERPTGPDNSLFPEVSLEP